MKVLKKIYIHIKRWFSLRFYLKKFVQLRRKPNETAKGLGIGVFVGFLPINGIQMLTAMAIASITKASKIAAAIGTHITNPWTTIPILIADYYVGCLVLHRKPCLTCINFRSVHGFLSYSISIIVPMFVGGVILGIVFGFLSYIGAKKLLKKKVKNIEKRVVQRIRKKHKS